MNTLLVKIVQTHLYSCSTFVLVTDHPPVSEIRLLPVMDLNPSDNSYIFSTQVLIKQQAIQPNTVTSGISVDQQLWFKAVQQNQ